MRTFALLIAGIPLLAAPPVDPSTLDHKLIVGYQGWHMCPGDGRPAGRWNHWFFGNQPDAAHVHFDFLPDVSELSPGELYPSNLHRADGSVIQLYSSQNSKTVDRHFRWMADYNIDGAALQRFIVAIDPVHPVEGRPAVDRVLANVRHAAEASGRVFFVMYDIAGANPDTWLGTLEDDWKGLMASGLTRSPAYLHHRGKPVLEIAGIGLKDRPGTAEQTAAMIEFLRPNVTLIGSLPSRWRTLEGDARPEHEWKNVYLSLDVISPWTVGRYADDATYERFRTERLLPDIEEARRHHIDYMPVVFPGFSWHNLMQQKKPDARLNQIPRRGGRFLLVQATGAVKSGTNMIYGAMFDEVDEGTALYKLAATPRDLPSDPPLVPLDADRESLPSDWYLQMCARISRMLRP